MNRPSSIVTGLAGGLIFLLFLTGCVATEATMLSNRTYPATMSEDVVIYLEEKDVPGDFEKIAIIHTEGDYEMTSEKQMLEAARRRAAKVGANGILIQRLKDPSTGAKVAQAIFGTEANRKGEMIAIRVMGN
jgi:hypothetical protein